MTLYFAYGSNMSRALMRPRCRSAREIGMARLDGWQFIIMREGYASIVPAPGGVVHGVLWRLAPRDLAALNAYERLEQGLYRAATLPVRAGARRVAALVYVGGSRAAGVPRPGYLDLVLAAAREAGLPASYVASLARHMPSGWRGARAPETGEVA
ncbi:MAG TPA: gamma-glutamylcyclotransferase family protein [Xanthobacteraceae bacterium]